MTIYEDLGHEIAKVAYELYEKSGRIEGRDLENWLEAERIVLARRAKETPQPVEEAEGETVIEEKEVKEPLIADVKKTQKKSPAKAKKGAAKKETKKTEKKTGKTKRA